jgi:hypothetical protein
MLIGMMLPAEADTERIGRFHADATIGALPDVGTFDRPALASGHRAGMATDPFAMGGATLAILLPPAVLMEPPGQHQAASFCGALGVIAALRSRMVAPTSA